MGGATGFGGAAGFARGAGLGCASCLGGAAVAGCSLSAAGTRRPSPSPIAAGVSRPRASPGTNCFQCGSATARSVPAVFAENAPLPPDAAAGAAPASAAANVGDSSAGSAESSGPPTWRRNFFQLTNAPESAAVTAARGVAAWRRGRGGAPVDALPVDVVPFGALPFDTLPFDTLPFDTLLVDALLFQAAPVGAAPRPAALASRSEPCHPAVLREEDRSAACPPCRAAAACGRASSPSMIAKLTS